MEMYIWFWIIYFCLCLCADVKVRLAFLDMLLYMSDNLTKLDLQDIQEEVDTFMFEVKIFTKYEFFL